MASQSSSPEEDDYVDPETVLPRTGLIRGTPEKPSAYFTTAKTYVGTYIYIYKGGEFIVMTKVNLHILVE